MPDMKIFRILRAKYANSLTSSGRARRWNYNQQWVIYASSTRSLAALELVVHRASIIPSFDYKVMVISVPDNQQLITQIKGNELPELWREEKSYPLLQRIGSEWYRSNASLLLQIPSAVIPKENNYIINTKHPDFNKNVTLLGQEDYFWDERLVV